MISVDQRRLALAALLDAPPIRATEFSLPLRFGLGAGLYFEYFRRPQDQPSRFFTGLNRNLRTQWQARASRFLNGGAQAVLRDALRENALLFNLDRAPTTALMGMEMLAEQLADFSYIPDWQRCVQDMHREIDTTGSCYRRVYLEFLQEIGTLIPTANLVAELAEIADEWDALAVQFANALNNASFLERAASKLRRIAFLEEHFWGQILDL